MSADASRSSLRSRPVLIALAALVLIGAACLGYWAMAPGQAVAQECRASEPVAARISPLAKGEIAALSVSQAPAPPPEVAFKGPTGQDLTLSAFKGRTVLVNLWATWCVPCRQEMPALDKVQAEMGGPDFEVVAINVDTRNPDKPKAWLQENGIRSLAYYAEPAGRLLQVLQRSGHVVGLPTTLLVDATGCQVAILKGPAEWASPEATSLLRASLGR